MFHVQKKKKSSALEDANSIKDCYCCLVAKVMYDFLWLHGLYSLPGFSVHGLLRQEYWSGLPFLSPGDLPDQGSKPCLLHWQADSSAFSHQGLLIRKILGKNKTHLLIHTKCWDIFLCRMYVAICLWGWQTTEPFPASLGLTPGFPWSFKFPFYLWSHKRMPGWFNNSWKMKISPFLVSNL